MSATSFKSGYDIYVNFTYIHFIRTSPINALYPCCSYKKIKISFILSSDISDTIVTIREFTVEMIVQAASKCLFTIDEQYNISPTLPASMSAKFRIGSSLASACKVSTKSLYYFTLKAFSLYFFFIIFFFLFHYIILSIYNTSF